MKKILIFGPKGFLGSNFQKVFHNADISLTDITKKSLIEHDIEKYKPHVIINTAGKTGRPHIDWCERNKEETYDVNVYGAQNLLDLCIKHGIYFVHLGSGCIYNGANYGKGYSEEDQPNFWDSYYSFTKTVLDDIIRTQNLPCLNIRIRMPFGEMKFSRNLIFKLKGYKRVLDAPNSMTYIPSLNYTIIKLIELEKVGTYNVVNPGIISPFEIMQMYKEIVDPNHEFEKLELKDMHEVAMAPRSNCMLSTQKLENEGIYLTPVKTAVKQALEFIKQGKYREGIIQK